MFAGRDPVVTHNAGAHFAHQRLTHTDAEGLCYPCRLRYSFGVVPCRSLNAVAKWPAPLDEPAYDMQRLWRPIRVRVSAMNTQLTLSMDALIIKRAKQAARARNTSVSAMLAGLIRGLDALDHSRGAD